MFLRAILSRNTSIILKHKSVACASLFLIIRHFFHTFLYSNFWEFNAYFSQLAEVFFQPSKIKLALFTARQFLCRFDAFLFLNTVSSCKILKKKLQFIVNPLTNVFFSPTISTMPYLLLVFPCVMHKTDRAKGNFTNIPNGGNQDEQSV